MEINKYIDGKQLFDGHYRLIKLLSEEGGTADVWLAENKESVDTTFSEKIIKNSLAEGCSSIIR